MKRNFVSLIGNVGKDDAQVKTLVVGKVANFSLAVNESFKKKGSDKPVDTTNWFNIIAWGKNADQAQAIAKKGAQLIIEGRIVNRSYVNKSNVTVYVTEILADSIKEFAYQPQEVTA